MKRCDYHVHTAFCDGKNTSGEVANAAFRLGVDTLGFVAHSYTDFDTGYCIKRESIGAYKQTIAELKKEYSGRMRILCGVEQDYLSAPQTDGFDYVIGSVHYFEKDGRIFSVDKTAKEQKAAADELFGGDFYALAELYYSTVADVVNRTGADIIGHFDLISKFNKGGRLFDEGHPRYVAAWQCAADELLRTGKPFEVNTGAISRGYTSRPYPSRDMLLYILARGGNVVLNSDSHSADTVCFQFDIWRTYLISLGFKDERIVTL